MAALQESPHFVSTIMADDPSIVSSRHMTSSTANDRKWTVAPDRVFDGLDMGLAILSATIAAVAYGPIVRTLATQPSDFRAHVAFAESFAKTGILLSPAFLIHLLVAMLAQLRLVGSYTSAIAIVVIASHAALASILYLCARSALETRHSWIDRFVPFAIAIGVPLIQPVVGWEGSYKIGWIWTEPYSAPTYTLLKPFALLASVLVVSFLDKSSQPRLRRGSIWLCAVVMAAGTSAKPSFSIAALPAIVIVAAYHRCRNASFSMNAVALGFVVPALSVLAWQFIRTYSSNDPLIHSDTLIYRDSIVFAPLAVMKLYASDLFAKFLASTLLPLSVFVMYPRRAWADEGVRFSLLAFIFGSMYTYVLAEQVRLSAGNFLWSAYVTLFVLNYFVVVFLVGEMAGAVRGRHHLIRVFPPLAALFWQLVSGIETYLWALRSH